ncbi:unnamed protein product [Zymoseptoria tritici ST99CH_1A5]|uniref:Secreted protein n=4 Tax=Zymoseptoria tritici TaxID=1047171 RepID=F9XDS3_ZYMTI|nr:uncharacterized protein MYCGRDRAFT_94017 [Zymoseptoria tritici IPO323]SMQ51876.1 unnamed protein product [Zymoseptoria tritici ST99CH_3D7]SMR54346.1 unnamed protein product [Zymoseptoria tritici ST99CH_1E4]SMR56338.1 unnamed protein product [Zymoseptoria tritici ST99CH_3D1]SMY25521.1 unnamed protein product [Zymoseptoria tritici ST99CH_1A5]EGP86752.1 hypothetical protein MYCGRDRAFT_94017 [Zymoseptoria tritici IPO323]
MQCIAFLSAVLTALSVGVSGLALPVNEGYAEPCEYTAIKQNQSSILGYQLAGIADSPRDNDQTCNELKNSATARTFADSGLDLPNIQKPVCSASSSNTDAVAALPYIVNANTKVFTSQITSAIPASNQEGFAYLCDNIRFKQLSAFYLDDNTIVGAACDRGGPEAAISPQPFVSLAPPPADQVLKNYNVAASRQFAWNWCAKAKDTNELQSYCSMAGQAEFKQKLNSLQLDPETVRGIACSQQQVPNAQTLATKVKNAQSDQFATVVRNMSNAPNWRSKICGYLSCAEMDKVGLDGDRVWNKVCQ